MVLHILSIWPNLWHMAESNISKPKQVMWFTEFPQIIGILSNNKYCLSLILNACNSELNTRSNLNSSWTYWTIQHHHQHITSSTHSLRWQCDFCALQQDMLGQLNRQDVTYYALHTTVCRRIFKSIYFLNFLPVFSEATVEWALSTRIDWKFKRVVFWCKGWGC